MRAFPEALPKLPPHGMPYEMRPSQDQAPVLTIPAPPLNELGDAVSARWTKYFRWLVTGHYSCIIVYRCRSRGGFNQALRRYKLDNKGKPEAKQAEKIGIIMVLKDDGSGRPDHWEVRYQQTANEQRQAMTDRNFARWRRETLSKLVEKGEAPLLAPIEADALQWWLYSKFYNILSRRKKTGATKDTNAMAAILQHALDTKYLTTPEHWDIVEKPEGGLALRISDALREAIRIANS